MDTALRFVFITGVTKFSKVSIFSDLNQLFEIPILENNVAIDANSLMDYCVENVDYIPLLHQTGYLTIKEYNSELDEYTLGFPNEEVKYGFLNELLPQFPTLPTTEKLLKSARILANRKSFKALVNRNKLTRFQLRYWSAY